MLLSPFLDPKLTGDQAEPPVTLLLTFSVPFVYRPSPQL